MSIVFWLQPERENGGPQVTARTSASMARHRPRGVGHVGRDLTSGGSGSGTRIITAASFEVAAIISTFLHRWHLPHGVGRPTADDVLLFNLYDVCGRVVARRALGVAVGVAGHLRVQ